LPRQNESDVVPGRNLRCIHQEIGGGGALLQRLIGENLAGKDQRHAVGIDNISLIDGGAQIAVGMVFDNQAAIGRGHKTRQDQSPGAGQSRVGHHDIAKFRASGPHDRQATNHQFRLVHHRIPAINTARRSLWTGQA
jgi:hypothetical protein